MPPKASLQAHLQIQNVDWWLLGAEDWDEVSLDTKDLTGAMKTF